MLILVDLDAQPKDPSRRMRYQYPKINATSAGTAPTGKIHLDRLVVHPVQIQIRRTGHEGIHPPEFVRILTDLVHPRIS